MKASDEFFKLDDDNDPFENSMEGNMTLQEMTKALNEDMEGNSVPGVDGFTVNFIHKFWDSQGALVCKAVNRCKSKN